MVQNPDQVLEDVMNFQEGLLPKKDQFSSQEELIKYIEDIDRASSRKNNRTRRLTAQAIQILAGSAKGQLLTFSKLKKEAAEAELRRGKPARRVDESKTVRPEFLTGINQRFFNRWKKSPDRFDLRGIDTKTHSFLKQFVRLKSVFYTQKGDVVINDRNLIVFAVRKRKNGTLYAQNVINGRLVGKKTYARFGTLPELRKRGNRKTL